ncbi:MAG: DUF2279 domain-containing protein [Ginsengibacter sp.]
MTIFKIIFRILLFLIISNSVAGQRIQEQGFLPASENLHKGRLNTVIISEAAIGTLATIGLQYLWYKKFPRSRFHFFNDNDEWLNMDKVGHATAAYNIAAIQYNLMRWSGVNKHSSIWIAGGTALAYMSLIEISDGFSKEWGFSPGDMFANITGAAIFAAQQSVWNQQRVQMQFSFHHSMYAKYNPDVLGKTLSQRLLKDYNGQSYWLSFNISSFLGHTNFPKWINADIGYGAEGMTGAVSNPSFVKSQPIPSFERKRKLFVGITGAFTTRNNISYPSWINIFKVPSPALEWKLKDHKVKFRPLYF